MSELGQRLIGIVRSKAAENPDFEYESPYGHTLCLYVHPQTDDAAATAGCIIGQALWDAGFIDASLSGDRGNVMSFLDLPEYLGLSLDRDEVCWLRFVQRFQDQGYPWGKAILEADALVGLP